jgi:hypothetical protein
MNLALPPEGFDWIGAVTGCLLTPLPESPLLWRFRNPETGDEGRLLNVPGLLDGALVSVASRGRLYVARRPGAALALFMPGKPRHAALVDDRRKDLNPETARQPLYPAHWPKAAILRVLRVRFRTVVVLDPGYLLARFGTAPPPPQAAVPQGTGPAPD